MHMSYKCIRDHFNANNVLEIGKMEMHDMIVQTNDLAAHSYGIAARVYNWRGSGNAEYDNIYQYFSKLSDVYGSPVMPLPNDQFDFRMPVTRFNEAYEVNILDTPEEQIYLRIVNTDRFFGFQTSQRQEWFKKFGPIVWVDKKLPGVLDECRALDKTFMRAKPQPFRLEAA